jgi:hypothetical protein
MHLVPGLAPICDCRGLGARRSEGIDSTAASEEAKKEPFKIRHNNDPKGSVPPACDAGTYACWETENPRTLMVYGADRTWHLSNNCCGPNSCVEGPVSGTAYCKCSPTPRSLDNLLPAEPFIFSPAQPTSGPEDPDEPEFCTPGRFTCGDSGRKVYTCNIKGNWQLSASCTSDQRCAKGIHGEAYCVSIAEPEDDVRGSADQGSTTLLTVAKEAASSTARA